MTVPDPTGCPEIERPIDLTDTPGRDTPEQDTPQRRRGSGSPTISQHRRRPMIFADRQQAGRALRREQGVPGHGENGPCPGPPMRRLAFQHRAGVAQRDC